MYDNYRGLAVDVVLELGSTKPLRLEFPFKEYFWNFPKQKAEFEVRLTKLIHEAISQGWNPEKRGKPFVLKVNDGSDA